MVARMGTGASELSACSESRTDPPSGSTKLAQTFGVKAAHLLIQHGAGSDSPGIDHVKLEAAALSDQRVGAWDGHAESVGAQRKLALRTPG